MADLKQVEAAFLKADAAGDTEAATVLAKEVRRLRAGAAPAPAAELQPQEQSFGDRFMNNRLPGVSFSPRQAIDGVAGAVRGAGSIGATIMAPIDMASDALDGKGLSLESNRARRASMTDALRLGGADTDSASFGIGKLSGEIAGTAGVGGALANGLARIPGAAAAVPGVINALRTGGMTTGQTVAPGAINALKDVGVRAIGGAVTGGASAGLVDPEQAKTGAMVGGAAPIVLKGAGALGSGIAKSVRGEAVAPEVAALANRAKELGIDIPADRLVNSKPLNALASGLNYVPFSGRAATEAKLENQLSTATSKLIGQNSPNMTKALRDASVDLGGKFDATLRSTGVKFDQQLLTEATDVVNTAQKELGSDAFRAISSQLDELVAKGASGTIDGQAAYNIKRTLDRIGRGNGPEAFHATELKKVLMGALDRSLGPTEAAAFAKTREQYGNMLALEKIAKNGAEGDISVARLANMRNINNEPLQEIADIAAQFVKAREGQHGAMQRGFAAMGIGGALGPASLAATAAGGRGANMLLNSNTLKKAVLNQSGTPNALAGILSNEQLAQLGYQSAPVFAASGR